MNAGLHAIIKRIVAENGEGILDDSRRINALFADLAKDEPKPQKNAFVKCLEQKSAEALKNAAETDRALCKQRLAQRLHDEEGLDSALCDETLDLLETVLFGEQQEKIYCKNCGKELQEGWKICPYCSEKTIRAIASGAKVESATTVKSTRKWSTLLLLSAIPPLGLLGINHFYAGRKKTGIFKMICTFLGLWGGVVWWIIDLITIIRGKFKDVDGNIITREKTS